MAWWLSDPNFVTLAEFTPPGAGSTPGGLLNLGSHVIDSSRNLIYAQIPPAGTAATGPPGPRVIFAFAMPLRPAT